MFCAGWKFEAFNFFAWLSSELGALPQRWCVPFSDVWRYLSHLAGSFCTCSTCSWCRAVYVLLGPLSAFLCAVPVFELSHRFVAAMTGWGSGPSCAAVSWQKESNKWIAVYNLCFTMKGLSNLFLGILCLIFACFLNQIWQFLDDIRLFSIFVVFHVFSSHYVSVAGISQVFSMRA